MIGGVVYVVGWSLKVKLGWKCVFYFGGCKELMEEF